MTGRRKKTLGETRLSGGQFYSGQEIIVYLLFSFCFNKNFKCINVLYFYCYIVAISNTNSIKALIVSNSTNSTFTNSKSITNIVAFQIFQSHSMSLYEQTWNSGPCALTLLCNQKIKSSGSRQGPLLRCSTITPCPTPLCVNFKVPLLWIFLYYLSCSV